MSAPRKLRTRSGSVAGRVIAHLATLPPGQGLCGKQLAEAVGYTVGPICGLLSHEVRYGRIQVRVAGGGRATRSNPATYVLTDLGRRQLATADFACSSELRDELQRCQPQQPGESDAAYEARLFEPISPPVGPNLRLSSVFSAGSEGLCPGEPHHPPPATAAQPTESNAPTTPTGLYWTPAYPLPAYRAEPEPAAPSAQACDAAVDATHWAATNARFDTVLHQLGHPPATAPAGEPPALEVAVWMDGSLLIVRGGRQLHLSTAHTQQLRRFLAQTHPVT